jgi:hypothetical protein
MLCPTRCFAQPDALPNPWNGSVCAGSKKRARGASRAPGPGPVETKLNDAAPAAERKAGSLACADAKRRAGCPAQDAHKAVKPGSLSSGRIGYSSGAARTACGAGTSLKSAPTHDGTPVPSWLPERRRCELLRRPRLAPPCTAGKAMCPPQTLRRALWHVAYRTPIAQAPDAMRQSNPSECRKTRLASPSPYPLLGSITFGFHRCVTNRVPDESAGLKREARRSFGYAVNSCEFLWNDLEKQGVIDCAGLCRLEVALKPVLWNRTNEIIPLALLAAVLSGLHATPALMAQQPAPASQFWVHQQGNRSRLRSQ